MERIELGDEVRGKYSGYEGTATGRTTYLTGCVHIGVTSSSLSDGKPVVCWFDEEDLVLTCKNPRAEVAEPPSGGPMPTPPARHSR